MTYKDKKYEKYNSQILFKQIGTKGQEKIEKTAIAIIGIGALGTRCAELLCRAGIGKLELYDKDIVEESNLQRQTLFSEKDINKPKAMIAAESLAGLNKDVQIQANNLRIDQETIKQVIANIVIDCTDNMETRFVLNEHCIDNNKFLISGAVAGSIGTMFVARPETKTPCLRCVFTKGAGGAENAALMTKTCAEEGVLNTIATTIAAIQANEAIKIIIGEKPEQELIRIDLWKNEFEKIKVKKNPKCCSCNQKYKALLKEKERTITKKTKPETTPITPTTPITLTTPITPTTPTPNTTEYGFKKFEIKLCRTKAAFSTKTKENIKLDLGRLTRNEDYKIITNTPILLIIENKKEDSGEIIAYEYGELLFKTLKDTEKIKKIASRIYSIAAKK